MRLPFWPRSLLKLPRFCFFGSVGSWFSSCGLVLFCLVFCFRFSEAKTRRMDKKTIRWKTKLTKVENKPRNLRRDKKNLEVKNETIKVEKPHP